MLKTVLLFLVAVVAAFFGYVAVLPADGVITRSMSIPAKADRIFPHVNDFRKWEAWSPWAKLDPASKAEFEGPASGVGSIFKWSGNDQIGEGAMAIVESEPDKRIKLRMDFVKPHANTSHAEFRFEPEGEATRVTWTMRGERPFLVRAMCLLFNVDAEVGRMFEQGLANLSAVSNSATMEPKTGASSSSSLYP